MTTCKIDNKFYIGMHSTDNLDDGYLGSGKKLWYSIRKNGLENHEKKILEFLPNRILLAEREKEIVNEQFLENPMCMNLQLGGGGGFHSEEHFKKFQAAGVEAANQKLNELRKDPNWAESYSKSMSAALKKSYSDGRIKGFSWYGLKHSEETKQKMSEKASLRTGDKNSQYGTRWITNGTEDKKIKKGEDLPQGWYLGRK